MLIALTIVAVIVLVAVALIARRLHFGNTAEVDRVRHVDPEAAARIEAQRAEQGIRGMGQGRGF